jgi:hypothetical protein
MDKMLTITVTNSDGIILDYVNITLGDFIRAQHDVLEASAIIEGFLVGDGE